MHRLALLGGGGNCLVLAVKVLTLEAWQHVQNTVLVG